MPRACPVVDHARRYTVWTRKAHMDATGLSRATDFLGGDVGYDGITGVMKLAHAAEGLGIDVEMHGPGPAQRHVMTSIRNRSIPGSSDSGSAAADPRGS
ncbi:MAG: hypothetical protein R6U98_10985, partial [Pirellulaceae bacterium]